MKTLTHTNIKMIIIPFYKRGHLALQRPRDRMEECSFIEREKESCINFGECTNFLLLLKQTVTSLVAFNSRDLLP